MLYEGRLTAYRYGHLLGITGDLYEVLQSINEVLFVFITGISGDRCGESTNGVDIVYP